MITITEALSEINLIQKKISAKQEIVSGNLTRFEKTPDPFAKEGGSEKYIQSEIQSIEDLYKRWVTIRSAIAKANTVHTITIGEKTMTINEWLNWKREVATAQKLFFHKVHYQTKQALDANASRPSVYKDDDGKNIIVNLLSNVDYPEFVKKEHEIIEILERLDGQLSLKNATITIDI